MASLSTSTDSLQDLSAVDEELRRDVDSLRLLLGGVADEQSYSGAQESVGGKSRAIFLGSFFETHKWFAGVLSVSSNLTVTSLAGCSSVGSDGHRATLPVSLCVLEMHQSVFL